MRAAWKLDNYTDPGSRGLGIYDDGTAECLCWCMAYYIRVPLAEIREGRTRQCSPGCILGGVKQSRAGRKPRSGVNPADIWCVEHSTYAVACCGGTVAKGGEKQNPLGEVSGTGHNSSPSLGAVEDQP